MSFITVLCLSVMLVGVGSCSGDQSGATLPPLVLIKGAGDTQAAGGHSQLAINDTGANTAAWPLLAPGSAESLFSFKPDAAGTFFVTDVTLMTPGCTAADLDLRWHVGLHDQRGQLKSLHRLEPHEIIRLRPRQVVVLSVTATASKPCGEVKATFTARYVGRAGQSTDSKVDGQDDGDDTGGGDGDDGDVAAPPPAICAEPDDDGQPHGGITLIAQAHGRAACAQTLNWRVADHVAPSPVTGCKPPVIEISTTDTPPMVKMQEVRSGYKLNLAWISLRDLQARDDVATALRRGDVVKLAAATGRAGDRQCMDGGSPMPVIGDDFDLVLFKGDPRESCLAKGGVASQLKLAQPEIDLRVDYAYGASPSPQHFFWRLAVKADAGPFNPAKSYRGRLYHRRARAFVTTWSPMTAENGQLRLNVQDPEELRGFLAEQSDLDLLIASGAGENTGNCEALWILPYGSMFSDRRIMSAFHDATNPDRDRMTLDTVDLP